ncbi:hypothetical protein [Campylobacter rectus]|nr:hypothetical protein [Campylobacter rectus]
MSINKDDTASYKTLAAPKSCSGDDAPARLYRRVLRQEAKEP